MDGEWDKPKQRRLNRKGDSYMNEVKNLMREIDQWVVEKEDAIKIVAQLWNKFDLEVEDFIAEHARLSGTGARERR